MALSRKIQAYLDRLEMEKSTKIEQAALVYATTLREVLSVPGTKDNPSKPNEAPHKVTGALVGSIKAMVSPGTGSANVGPTTVYADPLARIRPYYQIAIDRCRPEIRAILFKK